jgi:aminoglycoside phosphotransferase (APT) family kinase protein
MRGLDEVRVSAWLAEHIDGAIAPFEFVLITGGRSNLTFKVTDATGRHFVLRRPPMGHVLATAHDMVREHRIISAVGQTNVPVAPTLGVCADDEVNGAPFYVMGFVDGVVLDSPERAAEHLPEHLRTPAAEHLIDVLADLHAVDVDEIGLGNLAKREGYIERQVKRWSTQWENSKTRELAAIEEVAAGLRRHLPEQQGVSIAHGDYRFGNCMLDVSVGRVKAVLDWELCTLGDPLADLGYVGVYWTEVDDERRVFNDPTGEPGFPKYSDMVERYATRTGRDVSKVDYYYAFGCFRLAVISEGVYARYLNGAMADEVANLEITKLSVEHLAETALAAVRRLG